MRDARDAVARDVLIEPGVVGSHAIAAANLDSGGLRAPDGRDKAKNR